MKYLVTGGLGMIGGALTEYLIDQGHEVDVLDAYTYASDPDRIKQSTKIYVVDICNPIPKFVANDYDYILHLAAETHVDNSIKDPLLFAKTNVIGTVNMLEFARRQNNLKRFLYFSTDEVFGPAPEGVNYKEDDRYNSGNPYAAGKAGGEEFTVAYGNTYQLPVLVTHTMNVFGPRQHVEKFIPSTINKVINGEEVIIHANKDKTKAGSRFYIHTENVAKAVDFVLQNGKVGEKYNIVGEREVDNLELAQMIAGIIGKPLKHKLVDFHSSRPGHDLRYALDGTKLKDMGFKPVSNFWESLKATVEWYVKN